MIIRKLFKFEGSHIVRNCSSERCSRNVHGHSYKVEVFLSSDCLDNAGMIMDFGLMQDFKAVVDAFDHSHIIWREDNGKYREFFMQENERWILSEFNPSAEILSLIFFYFFDGIIKNTEFSNGEGEISVKSVRVHETDTGYAECNRKDFEMFLNQIGNKVIISFSSALREFLPKTVLNVKRIIPPPRKLIKQDEYLNNLNLSTHG